MPHQDHWTGCVRDASSALRTALLFAGFIGRTHAQGSSSAWRVLLTNAAGDGYSGWAADVNQMDFYDWTNAQLMPESAFESGSAFDDVGGNYGASGMIFIGNTWGGRADSNQDFFAGGNWTTSSGVEHLVDVAYVMFRQTAADEAGAHRKSIGEIQRLDDKGMWVAASDQINLGTSTVSVQLNVFYPPPSTPPPVPPEPPPEPPPPDPPPPPPPRVGDGSGSAGDDPIFIGVDGIPYEGTGSAPIAHLPARAHGSSAHARCAHAVPIHAQPQYAASRGVSSTSSLHRRCPSTRPLRRWSPRFAQSTSPTRCWARCRLRLAPRRVDEAS